MSKRTFFASATKGLKGSVRPPADKSISHRAAIVAGMCEEPVAIRNYLEAGDTLSTLAALEQLGVGIAREGGEVTVRGCGLRNVTEPDAPIDVGNAGTLMRLLPGWLAAQEGETFELDGDESIRRRPVDRIAAPLRQMGAKIEAREDRYPPFRVTGARLQGIEYKLPVASAQVKSCVLLAALCAEGRTTVVEPQPSRDHTERMLRAAGVTIEQEGPAITITTADELAIDEIAVPGDPSSAAFLVAAALLVPGSRVTIETVGVNWTRAGFFEIARRMGASIEGEIEPRDAAGLDREPVANLVVSGAQLTGTVVEPGEVPLAIDELPLVALLGCFAEGETEIRGAGELRVKESDRIAAVADGLRALGGDVESSEDGLLVRGTGGLRGGAIDAGGDHRMAMLGAVAGLASREGVEVRGIEAAAISYPGFIGQLEALL